MVGPHLAFVFGFLQARDLNVYQLFTHAGIIMRPQRYLALRIGLGTGRFKRFTHLHLAFVKLRIVDKFIAGCCLFTRAHVMDNNRALDLAQISRLPLRLDVCQLRARML